MKFTVNGVLGFNSRDGAIDRRKKFSVYLSCILVSIPEMVRLIECLSVHLPVLLSCFNSRDGAIDSCYPVQL